ncbi:hypothetical protein MRB53_017756 [Persea americana]|uniref:Uncharacterized protein n=1 Tax=Persea americana TaxID=3435 RepID=A0ACC2M5Z0_PERAE|nr:hypothetical protein MRB53_017756 [Persea americana]
MNNILSLASYHLCILEVIRSRGHQTYHKSLSSHSNFWSQRQRSANCSCSAAVVFVNPQALPEFWMSG